MPVEETPLSQLLRQLVAEMSVARHLTCVSEEQFCNIILKQPLTSRSTASMGVDVRDVSPLKDDAQEDSPTALMMMLEASVRDVQRSNVYII